MDRKGYIGGSDIAPICGLSPWKTPLQVYLDKVGESEPTPDNPAMAYGRMMEPVIRQWYESETGYTVEQPNLITHPKHSFLVAHLDGWVPQAKRTIEIKTARSADDWGEPGTDAIPTYYMTQVQYYLALTAHPVCDVPVSFFGRLPEIYTVEADAEVQELLIEKARLFWGQVQRREPPEPTNFADVKALFGGKSVPSEVMAPAEIEARVQMMRDLQAKAKAIEAELEDHKAAVLGFLGENEVLTDPAGKHLLTWKMAKGRKTFDAKRFAAEYPGLYEQFIREGAGSRRLLIK